MIQFDFAHISLDGWFNHQHLLFFAGKSRSYTELPDEKNIWHLGPFWLPRAVPIFAWIPWAKNKLLFFEGPLVDLPSATPQIVGV